MEQIQKTSSEQKLNELEYDIERYKENRMNSRMIDEHDGKTFKMPKFSIKYQGSIIMMNNLNDISNIAKNILSNGVLQENDIWNKYNRIYIHFLLNKVEILFKMKRKRRFEEERCEFNYEQITVDDNKIILKKEDMKITLCWSDQILMNEEETIDKYILIEIPYGVQTKYILHSIKDVINEELVTTIRNQPNTFLSSTTSSTSSSEESEESEELEETSLMQRHEREREIEMGEVMSEENELEVIDLTIMKNLGMIDLTMDISEEESPIKNETESEYESNYEPEPNFYDSSNELPNESSIDLSYDSNEHIEKESPESESESERALEPEHQSEREEIDSSSEIDSSLFDIELPNVNRIPNK